MRKVARYHSPMPIHPGSCHCQRVQLALRGSIDANGTSPRACDGSYRSHRPRQNAAYSSAGGRPV